MESNGDAVLDMGFDSSLRRDVRILGSFCFHLFLAPSFFQGIYQVLFRISSLTNLFPNLTFQYLFFTIYLFNLY